MGLDIEYMQTRMQAVQQWVLQFPRSVLLNGGLCLDKWFLKQRYSYAWETGDPALATGPHDGMLMFVVHPWREGDYFDYVVDTPTVPDQQRRDHF